MTLVTENPVIEISASSRTDAEDVLRCLYTLYGSHPGEQALDRDFGIDTECLSLPIEAAKSLITQEFVEKTARYEPRAAVLRVDWTESEQDQGILIPKVVLELV